MRHFPLTSTTTHATPAKVKLVVRGSVELRSVWPDERPEPVAAPRTAEVGAPRAVLELLAAVDGDDVDTYAARYVTHATAIRTLTAHCEAAILQAALQVDGELSPKAVLTALHADLRSSSPLLERLAS